jgi:uncharacterized membrane protein YidH (DUF202 family)
MPSPDDGRGLARERTGLAWERSAAAFAGLAGVVLAVAAHRNAPGLLALGAALLAVAGAVWRAGRRAYAKTTVRSQPRMLAFVALATVLSALAAAIAVIVQA